MLHTKNCIVEREQNKEFNYVCFGCDYHCRLSCDMKEHITKYTGEKPFICNLCSFKTSRLSNLENHKSFKHGELELTVNDLGTLDLDPTSEREIYGEKFSIKLLTLGNVSMIKSEEKKSQKRNVSDEQNSRKRSTTLYRYKCYACAYSCSRSDDMKKHIRKHTGEKPFQCNKCLVRFTQSSSLKIHIKRRHSEKETD